MIEQVYKIGLEKFEGDHEKAAEFTKGFLKQASSLPMAFGEGIGKALGEGAGKAIGAGVAGLGIGLGIAGLSAAMHGMAGVGQRAKFDAALKQAITSNSTLMHADRAKLMSYAETMFKFAPQIASDPNLLANVLSSAIHGESMDLTTVRTLADLESRYSETKKNGLFSPKAFV